MKTVGSFLIISLALLLSACGSGESFQVMVNVDGLGTQNVRAVYNDGVRTNVVPAMAIDGKFQFLGASDNPVLIDLYTRSLSYIGSVVAVNGDNIEASFKLNEPGAVSVKGNDISEQLSAFIKANAAAINSGDSESVNRAIADYVAKNPSRPTSLFLILSLYDVSFEPAVADSLLNRLDYDRRSMGEHVSSFRQLLGVDSDSLTRFEPVSLYTAGDSMTVVKPVGGKGVILAFTDDTVFDNPDSAIVHFNRVDKLVGDRARLVHFTIANDSVGWANPGSNVKATFTRCWDPMGVALPALSRLAVGRVPWFVAVDSTGSVIYRGAMEKSAVDVFSNR